MAHAGHHGGGGFHRGGFHSSHHSSYHSYHHYHNNDDDNGEFEDSSSRAIIAIITVILIAVAMSLVLSRLSSRSPIKKDYEISSYILDNENYFKDTVELRNGLKYFYEKSGVQIVVMTTSEEYSDEKTLNKYYELFNDESHILVVIPTNNDSIQYYAIGDNAGTVINDLYLNTFLENISCSEAIKNVTNMRDGKIWEKQLKNFADSLIK